MSRRAKVATLFDPPRRARKSPRPARPRPLELIAGAVVGDPVTMIDMDAVVRYGKIRLRPKCYVVPRCESPTVMLGCLSCRQPIANLVQLLWHLEAAPHQTHVIARQCGGHGWEVLR